MKIPKGPEAAPRREPGRRLASLAGRLLIPLLLVLAASACGQRGPLYLPDAPADQRADAQAATGLAREETADDPDPDPDPDSEPDDEDEETP